MFNEYDVVELNEDMPEHNLNAGITGTVLMIYSTSPPVYEVEFSDDEGVTIALLTINGEQLKSYQSSEGYG